MGVVAELIAWLVGDFIPFGDLVSDVLLWRSLPQEKPDTYECSPDAYTIARLALGIGTVVDSIPEVSLLLAITAGVVAALVFGPAYMSTGENKQELAEIASSLWACARCDVSCAIRCFRASYECPQSGSGLVAGTPDSCLHRHWCTSQQTNVVLQPLVSS